LLGTFMVRSGVLTSVHSFAVDPTRGLVILALLAVFIGGAFTLFAFRASTLRLGGLFAPISREGALILNNLFLATAAVAVLVGTLYPLILEGLTGKTISVGAPFFSLTFGVVMAPLLIVLPFGPFLAWQRGDLVAVTQRLAGAAGTAAGVLGGLRRGGGTGRPRRLLPHGSRPEPQAAGLPAARSVLNRHCAFRPWDERHRHRRGLGLVARADYHDGAGDDQGHRRLHAAFHRHQGRQRRELRGAGGRFHRHQAGRGRPPDDPG